MTDWQTVAASSPTAESRRVVAPGWILFAASIAVVVLAAEAASQPDMMTVMALAMAWFLVGLAWAVLLIVALVLQRPGRSARHPVRWLGVPALLLLAGALMVTDVAMQVRLDLSRGAMDALVADMRAGRRPDPDAVGLFHVRRTEEEADGVRVIIGDRGWDTVGFWWFADPGPPLERTDDLCDCDLSPLGGGWWAFVEHF